MGKSNGVKIAEPMGESCSCTAETLCDKHAPLYYTHDEKKFLDGIGKYTLYEDRSKKRRRMLLRRYIKATKLRNQWCNIDELEVVAYAKKLLAEMETVNEETSLLGKERIGE